MRLSDNLLQEKNLNNFSGGYHNGYRDDYVDQAGIATVSETV